MGVQTDILFQGATRPTMVYGVPQDAVILIVMVVMVLFIGIGNPLYLLVYPPLHIVAMGLCATEPRAFRLHGLALRTKLVCLNRFHWRSTSYSPAAVRHRRRGRAR